MSILLIHPPIAKPCEPPAGIARLKAYLTAHGIRCTTIDLNLEAILWALDQPCTASDRWSTRAARHARRNVRSLRTAELYRNIDRYRRAVSDLSHVLDLFGAPFETRLSLANYQHLHLSPVRSGDLLHAAQHPEDNPFYAFFTHRLRNLLEETGAGHVGFSLNFLHQALTVFAMAGFLRREYPEIKIILGGGLVTSWMSHPHRSAFFEGLVDHMAAGPGEALLLSVLKDGGPGSVLQCGSPAPSPSVPDYSDFPVESYLSPGFVLPYSASSGCYWNKCAFCPERAEGNPYVPIAGKRVLMEIRTLITQWKPSLIHFLDNAISPSLLRVLAENPLNTPWYGFVRFGRRLEDPEFCLALRRSGCVMLKVGLESGDESVIAAEEKGTNIGAASRVLENLRRVGIAAYVYLLFGTPSETRAEAMKTLELTVAHKEAVSFLNLAIFNMPIHGGMEGVVRHSHYEGDLSLYTGFSHPGGWHRGLVRQFLEREFKKHPAIAAILRREPLFFTSNHASFFR